MEQHRLTSLSRKSLDMSGEIRERKIRSEDRGEQPAFRCGGESLCFRNSSGSGSCRSRQRCRRPKGFHTRRRRALLDPDAVIDRQVLQRLREATGPTNRCLHGRFRRSQAKEQLLRVLCKKSGTRLKQADLLARFGFHDYCGADSVAIALFADKTKGNGWP